MLILLFLILLPLFAALFLAGFSKHVGRYIAVFIALVEMLFTFYMLSDFSVYSSIEQGVRYEINYPWFDVVKSRLHFGVDGISMLMLMLVNVLIPVIIFSSFNEEKPYPNSFFALIFFMQFGLVGVFTALDGLLFYLFWEITLIPIWFISGLWGQEDKRIEVTKKFFIYTFVGSLLMLVGLVYLYQYTDSFALLDLYQADLSICQSIFVFLMIFSAFAVKFPLFPFHMWLPDAHTYAPTQGSMLLSGIMLKMAVYGVVRYLLPLSSEILLSSNMVVFIILFSLIGVLYGAVIALVQNNIKTIIAYSSISHLGMMAGGIFATAILNISTHTIGGVQGAMLQVVTHGVNATGLFYCADILYKRFHTKDITKMGGMARVAPKFAILFMILILGSMGVPLTNGFVGEFILLKTLYEYNEYIGIFAGVSIVLGAGYLLRMYSKTMLGKGNPEVLKNIQDVSWVEFLVLSILASMVLFFGIFPNMILHLVKGPILFIFSFI